MNLNEWVTQILHQGDYFGVRKSQIKGKRIQDNQYELYFIDDDGHEDMVYIEKNVYDTFYQFLHEQGWEHILVAKYIAPDGVPAFVLNAEMDGVLLQYHFYVQNKIVLYANAFNPNSEMIQMEETTERFQEECRLAYRYILEYIKSRYNVSVQLDRNMYYFLEEIPEDERHENPPLTASALRDIIWNSYNTYCTNFDSPEESTYKTLAYAEGLFNNAKYKAVTYLSLIHINQTNVFESQDDKTILIDWLMHEYMKARNLLTENQKNQITEEGIELI